jgi:2-oxoglutarate ferredoxin oxidoreductase subunit gamma
MRIDLRMSGVGGQGIVTIGYVIGKAAALYDKKDVIMTEAYGPEITGGWSKADVIISDNEIDYPLVESPDVLIVMSQEGFEQNGPLVKKGGLIIYEKEFIDIGKITSKKCIAIPAIQNADELGKRVVANVVMMGAFQEITKIITKSALEKSLKKQIPKGTEELNMTALTKGYQLGKTVKGWSP